LSKRLRLWSGVVLTSLAIVASLIASGVTSGAGSATSSADKAQVNCSTATIGYLGPTTGPVASIGEELKNWSLFAIRRWNAAHKLKFKHIEGDSQFDPAQDSTIAQQFVSKPNVLVVLGPAASQEVLAAAPIFKRGGMPYIAASATRTSLTNGSNPGFFRTSPNDDVAAPTIANYIYKKLKLKNVYVIDDQSSYSTGIAADVISRLNAHGVKTGRTSTAQTVSDFSAIVTSIPSRTQLLYAPWQLPDKEQILGQQMKEQGKKIPLWVGDNGLSDSFTIEGAYFATFAPDIRAIAKDAGVIKAYHKAFGKNAPLTNYGPPAYVAAQAALTALAKACVDGRASRAEVKKALFATHLKTTILGRPISFTKHGDLANARFYVFKVKKGKKVLVPG
jgi:branched-chain amino acid transport system substrate-binding protein